LTQTIISECFESEKERLKFTQSIMIEFYKAKESIFGLNELGQKALQAITNSDSQDKLEAVNLMDFIKSFKEKEKNKAIPTIYEIEKFETVSFHQLKKYGNDFFQSFPSIYISSTIFKSNEFEYSLSNQENEYQKGFIVITKELFLHCFVNESKLDPEYSFDLLCSSYLLSSENLIELTETKEVEIDGNKTQLQQKLTNTGFG